ncbi:MAG: M48 family metalloprotease [Catalinimonas sp.]
MRLSLKTFAFLLAGLAFVALSGCDENGNFNLLSVEEDIELGRQLDEQIQQDTAYDVLPEADYPQAYAYLRGMVDNILASGQVPYADAFPWKVTIIRDDSTLNAFAAPGGYMYVYTGLIKYLDTEDQLAGVMGHEMGHAALRHSSRNLTSQYGTSLLLQVILGDGANSTTVEVLRGLRGLQYSRSFEREADDASVEYLAETPGYACNAAAGFFVKLSESGQARPPEFLSTHPNPENRVTDINAKAQEINCSTDAQADGTYDQFKARLP